MTDAIATKSGSALALGDQQRLKVAVVYDQDTGLFHRLKNSSHAKAGDLAGCTNKKGYVEFNVLGKLHRANRLAWLYVHGEWPKGLIDHKDGDKSNNAITNLRDVNNKVNCENRRKPNKNNGVGLLGVRLHAASGKYEARIRVSGDLKYLGLHDTPEIAHAAYISAKRTQHKGNTL